MQVDERIAEILSRRWKYYDFYHSHAATVILCRLFRHQNWRDDTKPQGQKLPTFLTVPGKLWEANIKNFIYSPVTIVEDGKTVTDWKKLPAFGPGVTSKIVGFFDREQGTALSYSIPLQWAYDLYSEIVFINGEFNLIAYQKFMAHIKWCFLADSQLKGFVSLIRHQGMIWREQEVPGRRKRKRQSDEKAINTTPIDCGMFNYSATLGNGLDDAIVWAFSVAHLGVWLILSLFAYSKNRMDPKNPHMKALRKILGDDFDICFGEDGELLIPIKAVCNKISVRQIANGEMARPFKYLFSVCNSNLTPQVLNLAKEGFMAQAYQESSLDQPWVIGANQRYYDVNLFAAAVADGLNYSALAYIQGCCGVRGNRTSLIVEQGFCSMPLAIPKETKIWNCDLSRDASGGNSEFSGMKAGQGYGHTFASDDILLKCQSEVSDGKIGDLDRMENARKANALTKMSFSHYDKENKVVNHKVVDLKKEDGEVEFMYSSKSTDRNAAQSKRVIGVVNPKTKPSGMTFEPDEAGTSKDKGKGKGKNKQIPKKPKPSASQDEDMSQDEGDDESDAQQTLDDLEKLMSPEEKETMAKILQAIGAGEALNTAFSKRSKVKVDGREKRVTKAPDTFKKQELHNMTYDEYFVDTADLPEAFITSFNECVIEAGKLINGDTVWSKEVASIFMGRIEAFLLSIKNYGFHITRHPIDENHPVQAMMRDFFRLAGINDENKIASKLWIQVGDTIYTSEVNPDGWGK